MGAEFAEGKFHATLSRTNSPKDVRHDGLWLDFISSIKHIAANPKYREINLSVDGGCDGNNS